MLRTDGSWLAPGVLGQVYWHARAFFVLAGAGMLKRLRQALHRVDAGARGSHGLQMLYDSFADFGVCNPGNGVCTIGSSSSCADQRSRLLYAERRLPDMSWVRVAQFIAQKYANKLTSSAEGGY